jgi:hypothetical protein
MGKEALKPHNMPYMVTKLLTMREKKNYEFGPKFHNFWTSREFPMNLQAYEYFLNGLTNFT